MMKNIWPQPLQFTMILIRSLILSNIKFSFTFHNMSIGQIRSSLKFFFCGPCKTRSYGPFHDPNPKTHYYKALAIDPLNLQRLNCPILRMYLS